MTRYAVLFQRADGTRYSALCDDPDFAALRAQLWPAFLYAEVVHPDPAVYVCKVCGRPVAHSVEGELVCETCYSAHEDPVEPEHAAALKWMASHCEDCGRPLVGGGTCPACKAEQARALAELEALESADWGDGSVSPDGELRRAALDHRGEP